MANLSTLWGYAVLATLVGACYFVYSSPRKTGREQTSKLVTKTTEIVNAQKPKKSKKDGGQSSGDQGANKGGQRQTKKKIEQVANVVVPMASDSPSRDSDEVDNREFAKQMANAKQGTLLQVKAQAGGKQKSVKQSHAQEKPILAETSSNGTAPSSAAGGDADDDRSSLNSPDLRATSIEVEVTNGGISDMLEPPAPGPAVLRVTAPTNPTQPKKQKSQPAQQATETKKQRQNRKKAEIQKAVREEQEQERKLLAEKQRRTAREAEGRAAKDGSTFMAAKAPESSAWVNSAAAPSGPENVKPRIELLDTYKPTSSKKIDGAALEASHSESDLAGGDWHKLATMSEEEQMRRAMEDSSDNWETVNTKDKRGKKKATPALGPEKPEKKESLAEQRSYTAPKMTSPTVPGRKWDMTLQSKNSNGEFSSEYHEEVQDSEWEV